MMTRQAQSSFDRLYDAARLRGYKIGVDFRPQRGPRTDLPASRLVIVLSKPGTPNRIVENQAVDVSLDDLAGDALRSLGWEAEAA